MSEPAAVQTSATKVFVHELAWDMRSRNTDWRYLRRSLPQVSNFQPDIEFTLEHSRPRVLSGNYHVLQSAALRRLGRSPDMRGEIVTTLPRKEFLASGSQIVYSHSFPNNAQGLPLVWWNAIVDPEMQRSYGASEAYLREELEIRGGLFHKATAVKVHTDAEVRRHAALFPEIADRFVAVPYFTPHAKACAPDQLEKHFGASPVRILFVGNNAKRKGLDKLLEAFLGLPQSLQNRSLLTVISNFDRSDMALPTHDRIRIEKGLTSAAVMDEMRQAHIFVNVARLETFGLVFLEAMAQGLACVGPVWEVQREMLDEGRAGVNLVCEAAAIRSALERLITDEDERFRLARAGWERFGERYAPGVVAAKYAELFRSVAAGTFPTN